MPDRLPFYSAAEVAKHNVSADLWVSHFGKVYDLTPLVAKYRDRLTQPILRYTLFCVVRCVGGSGFFSIFSP